jgi:hypothetical protein
MKYEYAREYRMPILMELTYEDLQLLQRMAKVLIDMEELPEDHGHMYKGDIRKLEHEAAEALNAASRAARTTFKLLADND